MAIFSKQDTIEDMLKRLFPQDSSKDTVWGAESPFFWILTMGMVVVGVIAVLNSPLLRSPTWLIPFVALMLLHTGLHWLSPRLVAVERNRWLVIYLAGQGLLAFILSLMAAGAGVVLGLYLALIGESVGILSKTRWKIAAVAFYLGLSAVSYQMIAGWQSLIWWLVAVTPMTFFVIVYVILYGRQAEAREKEQALSRKLEAANQQLQEYAAQVEDLTLTAERQRMARELHDTLAQGLAGLILQLEAVNSHLEHSNPERAQAIVQQAMTRARATLGDARRAIDNLRTSAAASSDLVESVRAEADHFTAATGLPCALSLALPDSLSRDTREQALRALTEALTNVGRHAQATHVWVRLAGKDAGLEIEVRDDGCGFDPGAAAPGHYGLLGLRERARLAGGTLEIISAPGEGTTVTVWLPADNQGAGQAPEVPTL